MQTARTPATVSRFLAAVITLAVIAASILAFGIWLAFRAPAPGETLMTNAVGDSVTIWRNEFGIPHIIARSDDDAFCALGYSHAADRLWQMDLYRRIARGQLAEIFGEDFVGTDAFFRTLSLGRIADEVLLPTLSAESKRVLAAYTQGVNLFIESHRKELPFEFGALGYQPTPWRESDCLAIGRLMAFDMSMSFWSDLALGEIADRYGVARALALIPGYPNTAPTVVPNSRNTQTTLGADGSLGQLFERACQQYVHARTQVGFHALGSGSNCWAIRTVSDGKPDAVLANDPHLVLGLPPRWYQVHLTSPSYNVIGATLPGIPVLLIGRSHAHAWGVTNVMLDDCDYFLERADSTGSNTVLIGDRPTKLRIRHDTIAIRGGKVRIIAVRMVGKRPIISDAHPASLGDSLISFPRLRSALSLPERYMLSLAWTGYEPSDEIRAMLGVMRAKSWADFRAALRWWGAPALNITYADAAGNVGIQPAGFVPRRGAGNPNLPLPGWDTAYSWRGILRGVLPAVYNPATGFVLSANNKTADSSSIFLSNLWEPSSRAERIFQLLSMQRTYTERDAQRDQLDLKSPYAEQFLRLVLPILERSPLDSLGRRALELLRTWDGYMLPSSPASAFYSMYLERLMNVAFRVHLRQDEYLRYAFIASLPLRRLPEILARPTEWFNPDSATAVRLRDKAIAQAFHEAIEHGRTRIDPDLQKWRWGQVHQLVLAHPMASVAAYRPLLERRLNSIGGDATTVANGLWRIPKPFDLSVGASLRFVARLRDTVVYTILPGGVSGNPLSSNFADQLTLWANGGLLAVPIAPVPPPSWTKATVLVPQQ
ncbi:MAG: hypothetical protein AA908_02925 [Chlorobi bacterium NICIL-2]|nr:MAG: hypothetical protein AA908_02925 [Chlorobi bacterium NICIL-2]